MNHKCTHQTDLDELIGIEVLEDRRLAFHYGPLPLAMAAGEELVLERSDQLSPTLLAKLPILTRCLRIEEANEVIQPKPGFRITFS